MVFKDLIFPEIVRGLRGNQISIDMYRAFLSSLEVQEDGSILGSHWVAHEVDKQFSKHLKLITLCEHLGYKIYHVGKFFLEALAKIDRDIPFDKLPDEFCAYINFAYGVMKDGDGEVVSGAYVYIGPAKKYLDVVGGNPDTKVIFMSYVNDIRQPGFSAASFLMADDNKESLREALETMETTDYLVHIDGEKAKATMSVEEILNHAGKREILEVAGDARNNDVWRILLNCVLYIHSQDSKLERVCPYKDISAQHSKSEMVRENRVISECTLPVTFVWRLYEKERIYHKDKTQVQGHFRWQRCGPAFTEIRLIWIDEHERHYKSVAQDIVREEDKDEEED